MEYNGTFHYIYFIQLHKNNNSSLKHNSSNTQQYAHVIRKLKYLTNTNIVN